ncbi:lysophospholipid acyltransferase family protein [Methyloglobulus sp.]|uniref:lysophospholipid acyltransferase family protein n=1 Tax=Methyloglobulus sp. TaxID=2518622 RepID=UPI0032B7B797
MLRFLFYLIVVKPLVLVILGINARGREFLPEQGPAIIVANHNSHLDAVALMSLFPLKVIQDVHPVAAADYFLKNRWLKWFALDVVGIIPIERKAPAGQDVLAPVFEALDRNAILILFPEGTRGEPESMGKLKNGIGHILSERPDIPVIPVFFYGLGKSLPKGEALLVPFFIDAFIGEPLKWLGNRKTFMAELSEKMTQLQHKAVRLASDKYD